MSTMKTRSFLSLLALPLVLGCLRASADTKTWTGQSGGNWSTSAPWSPSGTPANGDTLVFPTLQAGFTRAMTNDLFARSFAHFTFQTNPEKSLVETGTSPYGNNAVMSVPIDVIPPVGGLWRAPRPCLMLVTMGTPSGICNQYSPGFNGIMARAKSLLPVEDVIWYDRTLQP